MNAVLIETSRLQMRQLSEADIPELLPLIGAREVAATTLRIPHPFEEKHAREFLTTPAKQNELRMAIRRAGDGTLVGGMGLHPDTQHNRAEIGYWIGVPYWRTGYATEAARAVLNYGFEQFNYNRIFAGHFGQNPASGNVLKKIGMKHEGCMRGHVLKWNEYVDLHMYGILREEWRRTRA